MTATAPIIIREGGSNAALIVAIIGLVLSIAALAWQAATFFLSGPRVKVTLQEGLRGPMGALVLGPLDAYTERGRAALENDGYMEEILAVIGSNTGRLPVTINGWSLTFGNKVTYVHPGDPMNPQLPYRLEAHSDATWCAPLDYLRGMQSDFLDRSDRAARVRGVLRLGNGREARSAFSRPIRGADEG